MNVEEKKELLYIARRSIEQYVRERTKYEPHTDKKSLLEKQGAFVTIKSDGRLRGCIGCIIADQKLYLTVRDMATQSATADPRFNPLCADEIDDIEIEISVLSIPEKVKKPEEIVIPGHGVIVKRGMHQGVYLPQVADETGWSRDEFLSSLCYDKAGLQPDAWKDPETELFTFCAEVFNEKEFKLK